MNTDDKEIFLEENEEDNEEFYDFRYNSLKKKGAIVSLIMIWLFCFIIFGVAGLHFLTADSDFSESENRVLAEFPRLSAATVADGSFMRDFETYLTDQFPFRDGIISLKTLTDRIVGKNEENGVYIGKNGYLFDSQTPLDKSFAKKLGKAVLEFKNKHQDLETAFLLVPNSSYVYSEYLPDYLETDDQRWLIRALHRQMEDDSILWPAAAKILKSNADDAQLYYKTDHHWTTRGAYLMFKETALSWGLEKDEKSIDKKFEFYEVSNTFEGTLASTSGVHDVRDTVEICVPKKSEGTYVVNLESSGEKTASLFFKEKLKNKNHYEVFLGGNYDKVIITTVSQSDRSLLLIKDSYANCMIPMLTPYFNKIVVIDPRYLTDSLDSIIKENDFTHMMYLYNANTLFEDSSLIPCLES
ncbi:MAG: hypothetical protein J6Q79_08685 [Clostridia bacterium]|nr:hypothetical protein [Clostridia bacterium]